MTRSRWKARSKAPVSILALTVLAAVIVSGCGSSGTSSTSIPSATVTIPPTTPRPTSATTADATTTTVTAAPSTSSTHPVVATGGGGTIAYEVRSAGNTVGLFTVNPDGGDPNEIGASGGYLAAWSPDASRIVFVASGNSGRNDLYVIDADGQNRRRLTDTPDEEGIPAWSPMGDTIAVAIPMGGDAEIYLLDAETGVIVSQLTDNDGIDDFMPAWSPDGSQIAYVTRDGAAGSQQIHVMSVDGENSVQLTDNDVDDYYPAWSPDGETIAFVSSRVGEQTLFTMGIDGSDQRQLTDGETRASRPAWSPDGRTIAYHTSLDSDWAIELINLATQTVIRLVESGVHPAWSR